MKNKVELVINEDNFKPFYKVELYVSVEGLQDLRHSKIARYTTEALGTTVLEEIEKFTIQFEEHMKAQIARELKPVTP
jgi:hypothetical protein